MTDNQTISVNKTELPENWEVAKLEDVVDILDRKRIPINAKERAERVGTVPYYGATGQVGWIDDYLFDEELVLLGEDGAPFFDISKHKAYIIRGKSWVNNHAHVLRALNGIPNSYIKFYLDVFDYHGYVTGTTRLKLNQTSMRKIPVPIAPPNEQKRIVEEIEKQFSSLDEAVDNLKRVKVNLKRYKASVLKAAVEGKLTEDWRKANPDVEPAGKLLERILAERRKKWEEAELAKIKAKGKVPKDDKWKKKYKEPPQVDTAVLPELPDGWAWANFERLAEDIPHALKAGPFGSSLKKSFYVPNGYKIYGQEQVLRNDPSYGDYYIDEERYEKLKNCSVKPGDILISLVGTIGKVLILPEGIEPGIINPRLVKLSLDRRLVDENYIKIYLQSPYVKYLFSIASHGGTMDILNLTILKEIPIPVPPLEEQKDIIKEIERISSIEIELNTVIEANITRAYRLRQSILKKAFSGQLVEQHNNDESDRELLGTIKAKV